ncbi:hypothetical protein LTR62_003991 [Meristemomyces frigidus]|uniref:Uncharacterized protein n=1 Tax=Meristemomyces frigidus TaxID=1508187 RepID=A0AAN7TWJ5_9PEZI|nr:hypothetical protein LTR62_003991 [Meristemomyces frigidus]
MSSEQTCSSSDLRSTAQDSKREATRKHKWALGGNITTGRAAGGKPRPHRPSETDYNTKRRESKGAVAALQNCAKVTRKQDMLDGTAISDDSGNSASDYDESPAPPVDGAVMYSFDAARAPTQGSQILNTALAKAVEKFKDRETVKLVKNEYDILDDEGESVGLTPAKKSKKVKAVSLTVPDADEDYELV